MLKMVNEKFKKMSFDEYNRYVKEYADKFIKGKMPDMEHIKKCHQEGIYINQVFR